MKLITLKYGHVDTTFGPSSPDFPLLVLFSSHTYLSLSCFHLFSITSTDSSFSYRKLIWTHTQSIYTVLYYIPVLQSSSMHLSSQLHHDKTVMTLATNKDKFSLLQLAFHRHPSITALLNDLLKNGHSVSTDYAMIQDGVYSCVFKHRCTVARKWLLAAVCACVMSRTYLEYRHIQQPSILSCFELNDLSSRRILQWVDMTVK